jgi:hypothetical protein
VPEHDEIEIQEQASVRDGGASDAGATAAACDAAGPFRGHRCTEPAGHAGDHQHHQDGARAVWTREG